MGLNIDNLTVKYDNRKVLTDLSCTVLPNQFTALLGSNGSGKTTLLKSILSLIPIENGDIYFNETNLRHLTVKERAKWMSYMPQHHTETFNYQVIDFVELGGINIPSSNKVERAYHYLKLLEIEHLAHRLLLSLSGGQKQLVRLAQLLMQETPLILLDEPTNHLDFGYQHYFLQICQKLTSQGKTIIMTTHHPQDVLNYCDRVIILDQHEIIVNDNVTEGINAEIIEKIYRMPVKIVHPHSNYPPQIIPMRELGEKHEK